MKTSEKIRNLSLAVTKEWAQSLDALADEVEELEKQQVPDGWMPYWLIHEVTEAEVHVDPSGWWLEPDGDPDKAERLGDFALPFQEAIALAEAAEETPA